jgi:hypothetical protein
MILCSVNRYASDIAIFIAHEYYAPWHTVCSCFSWIFALNPHKMWKRQRFLYARHEVHEGRWGTAPLINYEVGDGIIFYMIQVCYYSPSTSWSPVCFLPLLYSIRWRCLCNLHFCRDRAQFCAKRGGWDPCDKMADRWAKLCHQGHSRRNPEIALISVW